MQSRQNTRFDLSVSARITPLNLFEMPIFDFALRFCHCATGRREEVDWRGLRCANFENWESDMRWTLIEAQIDREAVYL